MHAKKGRMCVFKDVSGYRKKASTVAACWPILNEHSLESLQCVPEVFRELFSFIFLDLSFGLL